MKTKSIFLWIAFTVSTGIPTITYAQAENVQKAHKALFVRVYDQMGNKIRKGHIAVVNDSSLQLQGSPEMIPVARIGSIKTKHSAGNNVLIGSVIGTSTMAILGAVSVGDQTPEENFLYGDITAGEGAATGAIFGLPLGAAVGAITILFKNSKTYIINGDGTKWKAFQSAVAE